MQGDQRRWSGRRAVTAFGLLTVAFWLSRAVFPQAIPPLVPLPDLSGLLGGVAPWIRQMSPALDRPDADVVASLRREILWTLAVLWFQIGSGVLAGILIVRRKPAGRWLALILGGVLLAGFLVAQGGLARDRHLIDFWSALALHAVPLFVRHLLDVLFLSATLVYLTRRPVALQFARAGDRVP